jgi:hypothetical protein
VRKGGLEPPRFYPPDPKLRRIAGVSERTLLAGARSRNPERNLRRISRTWCERGDSNPHGFTRQILSLVRLPIPPLSHGHSQRQLEIPKAEGRKPLHAIPARESGQKKFRALRLRVAMVAR